MPNGHRLLALPKSAGMLVLTFVHLRLCAGASCQLPVDVVDEVGRVWPMTYRCVPHRYRCIPILTPTPAIRSC